MAFDTQLEQISYAIGTDIGRQLQSQELELDTTATECATFIGEFSNDSAMDFPDFLEVMCSGAGTPEQVLLRRFNSVRKKLEYNSEDSCSRAG